MSEMDEDTPSELRRRVDAADLAEPLYKPLRTTGEEVWRDGTSDLRRWSLPKTSVPLNPLGFETLWEGDLPQALPRTTGPGDWMPHNKDFDKYLAGYDGYKLYRAADLL